MPRPALYHRGMLDAALRYVQERAHRKQQVIPFGFNWMFIGSVDVTMVVIGGVATVQRPVSDWPIALVAMLIAFSPWLLFFFSDLARWEAPALWAAWTGGTSILLFATTAPIEGDFAPLLLSLTVGVVTAITSVRGGALAAASAALVLVPAALLGRLDTPYLYLSFVGLGWLVGHLVRIQQDLLNQQREAQARLAAHAVADERRRIAREVHDVIAHSLSITLLHVTAARHALQHDATDAEAIAALEHAERHGREAMTDIRQTVGLLDEEPATHTPEPCLVDIDTLAGDFTRAGLDVDVETRGDLAQVSAAVGLALYRVAQESLSNIAKHAPDSRATLTVDVSSRAAALSVVNHFRTPVEVPVSPTGEGRGLRGMRQRIESLGGEISAGPVAGGWAVHAKVVAGLGCATTTWVRAT